MKREVRIACFDDSPFTKGKDKFADVIGVIIRGNDEIDGILHFKVKVDGDDATRKLIKAIKNSKHYYQLKAIFIDGIAFAGFNVVDVKKVFEKTKKPVLCIIRRKPNFEKIEKAIKNLKSWKTKIKAMKDAGEVKEVKVGNGKIYFQHVGIDEENAKKLILLSIRKGFVPEGLRVAHLIATSLKFGESKGRA